MAQLKYLKGIAQLKYFKCMVLLKYWKCIAQLKYLKCMAQLKYFKCKTQLKSIFDTKCKNLHYWFSRQLLIDVRINERTILRIFQ